MVNPVQNNNNNTVQSDGANNPEESLKNALYIKEPTQESSSGTPMQLSINKTETLPPVTHEINTEDISTLEAILKKGPSYEYINNLGHNGELDPLTVDANGSVSVANRDVTHAITGKSVAAYVIEGDPPPPPPAIAANLSSSGSGDPHFVGLHGNHFEFQGIPGNVFNLLSDAKIQVNALFNRYSNNATVMGQIGIMIGNNKDKVLVSPGRSVSLNGSNLGSGQTVKLKEGTISVNGDVTTISTKEYSINIYNRGGYLDIGIGTTPEGVNRDEVMPNGVIGQTASGKLDLSIGSFLVHDGIFGTSVASNVFGAKTKADKLKDNIKEKFALT